MRLDKFICKSSTLSKPQALQVLQENKVWVNGKVVNEPSYQVHENNQVTLNDERLIARPFRYILMHKPAHTICSNVDEVYPSALNLLSMPNDQGECVDHVEALHIAGRLDADTTGLILITDDGRWTFNITLPNRHCEKVYRVGLSRDMQAEVPIKFEQGIQLQGEDKLTLPARIEVINSKAVLLTLTEGKFHQVKRMFAAVGNRVVSLHREKIGSITLDVPVGKWRHLTEKEVVSMTFKPKL